MATSRQLNRTRTVRFAAALGLLLAMVGVAANAAHAAESGRLAGRFSVHETVTADTKASRIGDTADVAWDFLPQCPAGVCNSIILRHRMDGYTASYDLVLQGDGSFRGSSDPYLTDCYRDSDGTLLVSGAYSTTEVMSLRPTSITAQKVYGFSGSFDVTLSPTASGAAKNCRPGAGTIAFTGSLQSGFSIHVDPVTSSTPLYQVPVTLTLDALSCPASVQMSLGRLGQSLVRKDVSICKAGAVPPTTFSTTMPVFNAKQGFMAAPGTTAGLSAALLNDRNHTSVASASTDVTLPQAPVWVGVGDSYTSGHHQEKNTFLDPCVKALVQFASVKTFQDICHTKPNDDEFSWVSHAVEQLNKTLNVPKAWSMSTMITGRSGASTAEYSEHQIPAMTNALSYSIGSWNIVSTTGGADDGSYTFSSALETWYLGSAVTPVGLQPPYKGVYPVCPDINKIYETALKEKQHYKDNIHRVYEIAATTAPSTRFVDVTYPYVLPPNASCGVNHGTWHGADATIDVIDDAHRELTFPDASGKDRLTIVDLRGRLPFDRIQKTIVLGYPHVDSKGQYMIAKQALKQLKENLNSW